MHYFLFVKLRGWSVPFDVNHFSYDKIDDSSEIESKTKARIEAILEKARNGEI